MPISAIGNKRPRRDAGFSLVETMAAVMVVALMASAVLLLAPGEDRHTRDEATRLAARIIMARDESTMVNKPVSLIVDSRGYGFERLERSGWAAFEPNSPLGFRAWPRDIEARIDESENTGDERVARFDAMGGATPVSIIVDGAGARWRVRVDASGETHVEPSQ